MEVIAAKTDTSRRLNHVPVRLRSTSEEVSEMHWLAMDEGGLVGAAMHVCGFDSSYQ
jgi:hypothetical protein